MWICGLGVTALAAAPSVDEPPVTGLSAPNDQAVVITNEAYRSLPSVPYATRDGDAFAAWLTKTRGVPASNVARLANVPKDQIEAAVAAASKKVSVGGTLWIFYAGNGLGITENGQPTSRLLGIDATRSEADLLARSAPLVPMMVTAGQSQAIQAVFLLDCGFDNVGRDGRIVVDAPSLVSAPPPSPISNVTVWTASNSRETALMYEPAQHGAFTYFAVGALSGWADEVNNYRDGKITLDEAASWVERTVAPLTGQHPRLTGESTLQAIASDKLAFAPKEFPKPTDSVDASYQAHLADRTQQLQMQAQAEWEAAKPVIASGGNDAWQRIDDFVKRWSGRTEIIDGRRTRIEIPTVAIAQASRPNAEWKSKTTGYTMIKVGPGKFTMGSQVGEPGRGADELAHEVTLTRAFAIGVTEVTQGQWRTVMGENPSKADYQHVNLLGDDLPVQNIDWCDAVTYANRLSAKDGLQPAYEGVAECKGTGRRSVRWLPDATGYRLPTEAEWEFAARAGTDTIYAGTSDEKKLCEYANVGDVFAKRRFYDWTFVDCMDGYVGAAPVRHYKPNAFGLYDMTGNVWEWAWDWYSLYGGPATDPQGHPGGDQRVYRGGSWYDHVTPPERIAMRGKVAPDFKADNVGLRLARTVP